MDTRIVFIYVQKKPGPKPLTPAQFKRFYKVGDVVTNHKNRYPYRITAIGEGRVLLVDCKGRESVTTQCHVWKRYCAKKFKALCKAHREYNNRTYGIAA